METQNDAECCQQQLNNTWHVRVDAPPHLAWTFEVHSLVELIPVLSELLCHAMSCGCETHGLKLKAVRATNASQKPIMPLPSPAISQKTNRASKEFGSHLIVVPCSQPVLVQQGYVMTSPLNHFADMGWVVFAAVCTLIAGILRVFVFVSSVEGKTGMVKVGNPFATVTFVLFALLCLILVLHRVNRTLAKITLFEADPAIIFFLVCRQWFSLTYQNVMLLGSWVTWLDDVGRLAIDLIFCVCISVCDAWNVRATIKCLFLICCLIWSWVKLYIGVAMMAWSDGDADPTASWLRIAVGDSCYVSSWIAISLFIFKAILSFAQGGDFAFFSGKLELRCGGKSRSKVRHFKRLVFSSSDSHPTERFAGQGYVQTGPQIIKATPESLLEAWSNHVMQEVEVPTEIRKLAGISYREDSLDDHLDDCSPGTTARADSAGSMHDESSAISWPSLPHSNLAFA